MYQKFYKNRCVGGVSGRGQVLLLWALLIPILILFLGVALDLGWYFFTVSRMQNAADAACVAVVRKFLEGGDESLYSDYKDWRLIDGVPTHVVEDPITGNPHIADRDTSEGDAEAKVYVKKDISSESEAWQGNKIADAYTNSATDFESVLWGYDTEDKNTLYYQVVLSENVSHLFLPGWFDPMEVKVQAVSKLTRYYLPKSLDDGGGDTPDDGGDDTSGNTTHEKGPNLFEQMKAVELNETYDSWTAIKNKKGSNAAADNRSVLTTGNWSSSDKNYREEVITLNGKGGGLNSTSVKVGTGKVNQTLYDDLFIDWRADIFGALSAGTDLPSTDSSYVWNKKSSGSLKLSNRVYGLINYDGTAYEVRSDKSPPDPLYAMIESEPINADGGVYSSSVRQIIINVNTANTAYNLVADGTDSAGNTVYRKVYKYRPILFFYEGPKKLDNDTSTVRDSLPVILNLNADFRGVLFAPNSPVVINGNGHKFEGMVIAKSFVQLATSGTNKNTDISGLTFYTDNYGNIQYQKNSDGSYKTIQPTIDPRTDPALILTDEEIADGVTVEEKYFFLFDDNVKFYNKADFNLSKSVFDAFDQALMTEYNYLNTSENLTIRTDSDGNLIENTDYRSINNLFTVEDAIRSD